MSSRMTYRGAGRSIRGGSQYGSTQQQGSRQGGNQQQRGVGGNPTRQIGSILPRVDASFLRESKFLVSKPISDILEFFNAIMRIDVGPSGGAMTVIIPNPQMGNPNAPVPSISDLKKLNAIAALINNAKKDSVSSDTKNQAMADAFRLYMGIPSKIRDDIQTSLTNNELTLIATTVTSIALLEENRKTISSNTASSDPVKKLLIDDVVLIKNASYRYLCSMIMGENIKDSPIKKRASDSGVCEFIFAKLTKKITLKSSEDLVNYIFPRNDWLAGFSLTFFEIRESSLAFVEKYSAFTSDSAVMVGLIRDDLLMKAVNFLGEDFSFTRESEILSRMNRKAVVMVPPYDLRKVAELISSKKTGVYDGRWAKLPNSLDPVSGLSALSHAFLRFKILQTSLDVSYLLDDLFNKGESFRTALKEKPIGEEFSVGNWIIKNICDDELVDTSIYEDLFYDLSSVKAVTYFERYLISQLGFLEDHRFTRVLRSILHLSRNPASGILEVASHEVTTKSEESGEDGQKHIIERSEKVYDFPTSITYIGSDSFVERPLNASRDYCLEVKLGEPNVSVPDPTSDAGKFRRRHFADSQVKPRETERRGDTQGSTALSQSSTVYLRSLYPKNKAVATSLSEFLKGFSSTEVQNYVVKVLHARENQLLGIDPMADLLSVTPDANDDRDGDLFGGLDD